ncbi:MAG: hypothetical protein L0271_19450 [Gemmatimonadetes bacterium]|nr:hypothetical protein [Gemmatimonadota bacterium]
MRTQVMLVTVWALLTPAALPAQAAASSGAAQARTAQARIDAALAAAAQANVPVSLIESKIAEGEAKGVAQERIAAAVEARVAALVRASRAMERADVEVRNAGELAVTADALEAGVSEDAVVRIGRDAPPERRVVAIAVLADLVRLGNATDQAFARVSAALSSSAALANMHAEVTSQLRLGGLQSTLEATGIIRIH